MWKPSWGTIQWEILPIIRIFCAVFHEVSSVRGILNLLVRYWTSPRIGVQFEHNPSG